MNLLRKCAAEFIGAFAIVFAGCGAVAIDQISGGAVSHVGVAATFGLVIMVMIYATGHISGAHFNPAVTLAFALDAAFSQKGDRALYLGSVRRGRGGQLHSRGELVVSTGRHAT